MQDSLGRSIRYLRLSLTHACAMRCIYCRPEGYATHRDDRELLPDEIESLITHLAGAHGLKKVRLTGGEPTVRAAIASPGSRPARPKPCSSRSAATAPGGPARLPDLAMTTNGLTLTRQAGELFAAGLKRINISLDSLNPQRFAAITGVDGLPRILSGITAAREAGLWPIRLNTVVVRGQNEDELPELLEFAAENDLEIRFIELMPMGPLHEKWNERYVPEGEMREILSRSVDFWQRPAGDGRVHHRHEPSLLRPVRPHAHRRRRGVVSVLNGQTGREHSGGDSAKV